jgi:hypothetical protein
MAVDDRIPTLTDKELEIFRGNVQRVVDTGKAAQKMEADRLLVLIQAEAEQRAATKKANAPPPRAKKVAAKPKKAAKKADPVE